MNWKKGVQRLTVLISICIVARGGYLIYEDTQGPWMDYQISKAAAEFDERLFEGLPDTVASTGKAEGKYAELVEYADLIPSNRELAGIRQKRLWEVIITGSILTLIAASFPWVVLFSATWVIRGLRSPN